MENPNKAIEEEQLFDFVGTKKPTRADTKSKKRATEKVSKAAVNEYKDPYVYQTMLERLVKTLEKNNPYANESKKMNLKPVQLEHLSSKKYKWANFSEFATVLRRPPEHLSAFVSSELGIEVVIAEEKLRMEGRRLDKEELQSILKKYILEYVKCPLCNNANTTMTKDPNIRSMIMYCESCRSRRTVAPIRGGLQAINR